MGFESDGSCDLVEVTLESKDALWCAESAERSVRRIVRGNDAALDPNIRARIGTRGMDRTPGEDDRRECHVSATIQNEFDLHREKPAILCDSRSMFCF
jgi:hypothetical protein